MSGILFDTSVYISALRCGDFSVFTQRRIDKAESHPVWLSAVVLEELYVGAADKKMKKLLAKFERDFEKINRLLVPNKNDWTACGQVLSLVGGKHGFEAVRRARMTNDCLIAMTAARNGFTVITYNAEDFRVIQEFRSFNWREI